jgi:hypothetical protein
MGGARSGRLGSETARIELAVNRDLLGLAPDIEIFTGRLAPFRYHLKVAQASISFHHLCQYHSHELADYAPNPILGPDA